MSEVKKFSSSKGDIEYLFIDNGAKKNLFLLHGYGANMRDLAGIAGLSPELKKFNWIFPDGILKVPIGPFMMGKAWFPIDMEVLNQAMMNGGFEHLFADHIPEGLEETSDLVTEFIHSFEGPYILGGFSQGSMLSNYLTFEKGLKPEALLLLSSTLVAKVKWLDRLSHSDWGGPIFQSHGVDDPVLPVSMARELKDLFEAHHRKVDYHEFQGGHEIPPQVLQAFISFLKDKS
jgi:phospholipase/carboxylesterase